MLGHQVHLEQNVHSKSNIKSTGLSESQICHSPSMHSYLFWFEDMAQNLGLATPSEHCLVRTGQDAAPGHYHQNVSNVRNVRDCSECVVHHDLLENKSRYPFYCFINDIPQWVFNPCPPPHPHPKDWFMFNASHKEAQWVRLRASATKISKCRLNSHFHIKSPESTANHLSSEKQFPYKKRMKS